VSLNQAAVDLSAATGKTYADAVTEIQAAIAGRATALEKDGVAIGKNASAMDIARAISEKYEGAQARLATTQGGKLKVANEKVGEAMEKVGKVMGDVASVVVPLLADAFTWVVDTLGAIGRAITPVTAAITRALIPVFRAVLPVARTVFGAVQTIIGTLGNVVRTVFGAIGTVIGKAVDIIKGYFGALGTAVGIIGRVFTAVAGLVGKVFSTINGVIGIVNTAIRAINSIQVHIHVGPVDIDWNGLNIRQIPKLHRGGVVPGPMGQEVPIMALGGERFIDPHGGGGGGAGLVVNVSVQNMWGGPQGIDELSDLIAGRLRLKGATVH
jgi:phage-related protein